MHVIACLSQKGGVGKSTLSHLIATSFATSGWQVKIADFNTKQQTSVDWSTWRNTNGITPPIPAETCSQIRTAMRQAAAADLMVVDGKPDSDATSLEVALVANLIIIPASTTLIDIQPQVRFANELVSRGVSRRRIAFVINQSTDSDVALADAREFIISAGYGIAKTDIPYRAGYQVAQNAGRSIAETTFPTLNERANDVAREIAAILLDTAKEAVA